MASTHFDPTAFLDMPVEEAFEKRPPVPAQDYPAIIQSITPRQWTSKDKRYDSGPNAGQLKSGIAYDVKLEAEVPLDIRQSLGLKDDFKFILNDSIMLDVNDRGGLSTEVGANRQLRNYREALDMNKAGVTFRARDMEGRRLLVRVKHDTYPEGSDNVQEKVAGVARI